MSAKLLLCRNLSLSIWLEKPPEGTGDLIKIRLVDKLAMRKKEVEIQTEPGTGTIARAYHLREAIVIGMRRLVDDAIKEGLISLDPAKPVPGTGVNPKLNIPADE